MDEMRLIGAIVVIGGEPYKVMRISNHVCWIRNEITREISKMPRNSVETMVRELQP